MFEAMSMPNIGFQVTFANGYQMSVQWGKMNYCHKMHNPTNDLDCKSVEIAIFNSRTGQNVTRDVIPSFIDGSDIYATFVSPENFAKITAIVEAFGK